MKILRADVITHGPAIFNEDHVVLNDRCTPQQIAEEESYPVAYADREGMLTKVAAVLAPLRGYMAPSLLRSDFHQDWSRAQQVPPPHREGDPASQVLTGRLI